MEAYLSLYKLPLTKETKKESRCYTNSVLFIYLLATIYKIATKSLKKIKKCIYFLNKYLII